jgi:hypothetical protein
MAPSAFHLLKHGKSQQDAFNLSGVDNMSIIQNVHNNVTMDVEPPKMESETLVDTIGNEVSNVVNVVKGGADLVSALLKLVNDIQANW